MTPHGRAHTWRNHGRTGAAVGTTSGRTPAHKRDTGEVWVMSVAAPGVATDLLHKGRPYHIRGKSEQAGGRVSASGSVPAA